MDALCIGVLVARVLQTLVHVSFVQSNKVVAVRFSLFSVQLLSFLVLVAMIVLGDPSLRSG